MIKESINWTLTLWASPNSWKKEHSKFWHLGKHYGRNWQGAYLVPVSEHIEEPCFPAFLVVKLGWWDKSAQWNVGGAIFTNSRPAIIAHTLCPVRRRKSWIQRWWTTGQKVGIPAAPPAVGPRGAAAHPGWGQLSVTLWAKLATPAMAAVM